MRTLLLTAVLTACVVGFSSIAALAGTIVQGGGDTYIAFEAESFESTVADVVDTGAWNFQADADASGGYTLRAYPGGGGDNLRGLSTYMLQFSTADTYRLYFRKIAADGGKDSLWRPLTSDITVTTGAPNDPHGIHQSTTYAWQNDSRDYTIAAGDVGTPLAVTFGSREPEFRFDRIVLSTNTGLTSAQLDALVNSTVSIDDTHFNDGDGADSNWTTTGNWDNGVPTPTKNAFVGGGNTAALSASGQAAYSLTIGHDNATLSGNGTLNQNGGELTVLDELVIGRVDNNTSSADSRTGSYTITGDGDLTVGSEATGRANLYVGYHTKSSSNANAVGTLDLSGADQFNAYLDNFTIGHRTQSGSNATASGTVTLAENNVIDATTILMSETKMYYTPPTSTLHLGANNTIKTDQWTVGGFRGQAEVDFAAPGGTLNLTGSSGTAADLRVAYCLEGTGNVTDATMDLTGGTFNATLDNLIIAYKEYRSQYDVYDYGDLLFDDGTVTANNVVIGWGTPHPSDGTEGIGIGTLTMRGGKFSVANDIELGKGTAGSGIHNTDPDPPIIPSSGTFTMTGGTTTVNGNVTGGIGSSTVNVDGGTLDVDGSLDVDTLRVGYDGRTATVTVGTAGVGTATVGASGDLYIGRRTTQNLSAKTEGTLDVSATSSFTANLDSLVLASLTGNTGSGAVDGTLILGPNNTINADTILLGYLDGGNVRTLRGTIELGASNTINADTFIVGAHKGTGDVHFAAGGTLDLSGNTGAKTNLRIGDNSDSATSSTASGTMDLSGGTFIANLGQLVIGDYASDVGGTPTGSGSGIGSLTLGTSASNDVQVDSVLLANYNATATSGSGAKQVSGTLTIHGGQFDVATDVTRGVNLGAANGATATSTVIVDGGTMTVGGLIDVDNLTLDGTGTIDADTINLASGASFDFDGGTLHVDTFNGTLVQDGGVLDAEGSPGLTRIVGDYLQNGGILHVDITGDDPGDQDPAPPGDDDIGFDLYVVEGAALLDGIVRVDLQGGYEPTWGTTFDVLTAESLSSTSGTIAVEYLVGGGDTARSTFRADIVDITGGQALRLTSLMPEPGTLLIWSLLAGLGMGLGWRRRK